MKQILIPSFLNNRRDKKENLWHIRNLIELAQSDGEVLEESLLVNELAARWNVSEAEQKKIRFRPDSVRRSIARNPHKRCVQAYDLVQMIACDGIVSTQEKEEIRVKARLMKLSQEDMDLLIEEVMRVVDDKKDDLTQASK